MFLYNWYSQHYQIDYMWTEYIPHDKKNILDHALFLGLVLRILSM